MPVLKSQLECFGSLTTTTSRKPAQHSLHDVSNYPDIILTTEKINDAYDHWLKVDPDADTCVLITTDLQHFPFLIHIKPNIDILFVYFGGRIRGIGAMFAKSLFEEKGFTDEV